MRDTAKRKRAPPKVPVFREGQFEPKVPKAAGGAVWGAVGRAIGGLGGILWPSETGVSTTTEREKAEDRARSIERQIDELERQAREIYDPYRTRIPQPTVPTSAPPAPVITAPAPRPMPAPPTRAPAPTIPRSQTTTPPRPAPTQQPLPKITGWPPKPKIGQWPGPVVLPLPTPTPQQPTLRDLAIDAARELARELDRELAPDTSTDTPTDTSAPPSLAEELLLEAREGFRDALTQPPLEIRRLTDLIGPVAQSFGAPSLPTDSKTEEEDDKCKERKNAERRPSSTVATVKQFARRMSEFSLDNLRRGRT
jgi:hypothetical protein